jgi:pyrroline-5-carboxylate reductase
MIPNAASVVGAGYNPIAFSSTLSESDRSSLISLLSPLGQSPVVPDENLEAYAIVTAMGPTYLWFQLSALKELALGFGLDEVDAEAGIKSMVIGAAKTMFESGMSEEEVIDLIPVKPIGEDEPSITAIYNTKLQSLFEKLKG